MIRHIVFDIGKVLIEWDPELPYRTLIPDAERRAWFLSTVCSPDWNREQDRGRAWREAEDTLIETWPEEAELIRAYRANWLEMVPATIPGTPDILKSLVAAGHDVTMLTNFSADTFALALERFPLLTLPRGVTVSGAVGLIKPDRAIYDHHAERFGLDPAATLFFDDSPPNITGAEAAGWNARHFTEAGRMRQDLAEFGIAV